MQGIFHLDNAIADAGTAHQPCAFGGFSAADLGGKRRFADVDAAGNDDALERLDGGAAAHGRRGETWAAYPKIIRKTQPRASGR